MNAHPPLRVVLVGGSGFLGSALRNQLVGLGHDVVVIGRGPAKQHNGWRSAQWNATNLGVWADVLDGSDAIVHLAGKRVDCRPTRSNIDALISSRETTVRLVGSAIAAMDNPPKAWIQLSSLARFGDPGDALIDESSTPPATGPRQHVEVCRRWEAAYEIASAPSDRRVLLRPGIAIGGPDDPATEMLVRLARLALAGPVGGGQQWVSWIAAHDLFDLLVRSVVDPTMHGLYHVTAPEPVRNHQLMAAYRRAAGRRFGLPSPAAITRLGAWLLGSDPALVLTGRRCVPTRLLNDGYQFRTTSIDDAVELAVREHRSTGHAAG